MINATHEDWIIKLDNLEISECLTFDRGSLNHEDILAAIDKISGYYNRYHVTNHGPRYYVDRLPSKGTVIGGQSDADMSVESVWRAAATACRRAMILLGHSDGPEYAACLEVGRNPGCTVPPSMADAWADRKKD